MRRTGKEGLYTRIVNKDLQLKKDRLESLESKREALGYRSLSDEERAENLESNLQFFVG